MCAKSRFIYGLLSYCSKLEPKQKGRSAVSENNKNSEQFGVLIQGPQNSSSQFKARNTLMSGLFCPGKQSRKVMLFCRKCQQTSYASAFCPFALFSVYASARRFQQKDKAGKPDIKSQSGK